MRKVALALAFIALMGASTAFAVDPYFWHQAEFFRSISWSPDGKKLAVGQVMKGRVQILSGVPIRQLKQYEYPNSIIMSVEFLADGEHVFVAWLGIQGGGDGAHVRNVTTDRVVWKASRPSFNGTPAPDGEHIATSSIGEIHYQNLLDPKELTVLTAHKGFESDVLAFTRDGRGLAASGSDGSIVAWGVSSGRLITTLRGHTEKVKALAFANRNGALASGGQDRQVILWNVTKGEPHWKNQHEARVNAVAISPDSKLVASGGDDKVVRLWDFLSGKSAGTFNSHQRPILGLAWHPGGHQLAVAYDGGVVVYSREDKPLVTIPELPASKLKGLALQFEPSPTYQVSPLLSNDRPSRR